MKNSKIILAAAIIMFAIGSALASAKFVANNAYSKHDQVPSGQVGYCVLRGECTGGPNDCEITFDPDDAGPLTNITVPGWNGATQTQLSCGVVLKQPN